MPIEIERKFLVTSANFKNESYKKLLIKQGFLNTNKHRVVRIRIIDNVGFISVKGNSFNKGTSRFEWEKQISKTDAEQLLLLCKKKPIKKYRYLVKYKNFTYEIDEFLGKNKGLFIAEIELTNKNDYFKKPKWLGKEVTGKSKYYNVRLSKHPFKTWKKISQ